MMPNMDDTVSIIPLQENGEWYVQLKLKTITEERALSFIQMMDGVLPQMFANFDTVLRPMTDLVMEYRPPDPS